MMGHSDASKADIPDDNCRSALGSSISSAVACELSALCTMRN